MVGQARIMGAAGQRVTAPVVTWNPLDKSADISLSNGDLTATNNTFPWDMVRATQARSTGKFYVEGRVDNFTGTSSWIFGVARASEDLNDSLGMAAFGWGYFNSSEKVNNNVVESYGASFVIGDVIAFAIDLDAGSIEFFINNVSQGVAYIGQSFGSVFPAWTGQQQDAIDAVVTARFNAADQSFSPPSGFAPWGG